MGHDRLARTPESQLKCSLIAFRAASRCVVAHADRGGGSKHTANYPTSISAAYPVSGPRVRPQVHVRHFCVCWSLSNKGTPITIDSSGLHRSLSHGLFVRDGRSQQETVQWPTDRHSPSATPPREARNLFEKRVWSDVYCTDRFGAAFGRILFCCSGIRCSTATWHYRDCQSPGADYSTSLRNLSEAIVSSGVTLGLEARTSLRRGRKPGMSTTCHTLRSRERTARLQSALTHIRA